MADIAADTQFVQGLAINGIDEPVEIRHGLRTAQRSLPTSVRALASRKYSPSINRKFLDIRRNLGTIRYAFEAITPTAGRQNHALPFLRVV
jgi:hypothetical protein